MSLFNQSIFFIAWRYIKGSRKQRFASLVAILATVGIAIGVGALIVVSSIMQGLQERLKANILNDCAHVVVAAEANDIDTLLEIPHVLALSAFAQGEAMLQYGSEITMVNLQGNDYNNLYVSIDHAKALGIYTQSQFKLSTPPNQREQHDEILVCIKTPEIDRTGYNYGSIFNFAPGSYNIALNYSMLMQYQLHPYREEKVRLISTQNARYTPFGLTPVQRNFNVDGVINSIDKSVSPIVIGNYEDVRRFFRLTDHETYYRLYLDDPFSIDEVAAALTGKYSFTDWRDRYGEFFKAVGLEKISMSLMLCLIVLVAAFNILSSLTMVVSSRVSEIAILKTLGMSNRALLYVFLMVGMSASIVGCIIGIALGIPLAYNAQALLALFGISIIQGVLPISIEVGNIIIIVVLCQAISLLCTFYPAYYASKSDPASHLIKS